VREGLRLLQEAEHRRLLEKWLIEGLTKKEEAELPPELLERAKTRVKGLIEKGLAEARAGLLLDGEETMRRTTLEEKVADFEAGVVVGASARSSASVGVSRARAEQRIE
jgi:hypothetical protein